MSEVLPPTEYLMLEALAARWRLGESFWSFHARMLPIARRLERKGYVDWKWSIAENAIEVFLTEEGRAKCLSPTYTSPVRSEA